MLDELSKTKILESSKIELKFTYRLIFTLCHINSRYIAIMRSLRLIHKMIKDFKKREVCNQAKITK